MAETLKVARRTAVGKNSVRKLRGEGYVPGVLYGRGRETTPVQIEAAALLEYLERGGRIGDITFDGNAVKVLFKEVQHDVFSEDVLHVDLQLVSMTEKIRMSVPVALVGEPSFPPEQGIVEHVLKEVEIECLPGDAPDVMKAGIRGLQPGGVIHVREMEPLPGVVIVTSGDEIVAAAVRPRVEEEAPAAEGEEFKEPEIIGARKKEEEEGEAKEE